MLSPVGESYADVDPTGGLARLGLAPGNARLFEAVVERAPVGVFLTDVGGACLYANECLCELTGLPLGQQLGYGWREALHPDDASRVGAAWEKAAREGTDLAHDQRFVRSDGSVAWVEMTAVPMRTDDGRVTGWAGVCVDVTRRRLSEKRYRDLVEHARDAIFMIDTDARYTAANRATEELTGYSREELLKMTVFDLLAPGETERIRELFKRSLSGQRGGSVETLLVAKGGRRVFVEATYRMVEEAGEPVGFETIARDMTERHSLVSQLKHQAFHDPLTGLPNRALLLDRLGQALARASRTGALVAVIVLDLDNFKLVNDSLGHDAGDELLRSVAPRLLQVVRDGDTVARLGGDEFTILIETLEDEREAVTIAERIVSAFEAPFAVGVAAQRITASLGIALARTGDDPSSILRNADTAMYAAKETAKGSFELFDDGMRRRLIHELTSMNALSEALSNEQLQVYYQPIVSLDDQRTLAVEALVRWRHPEWGWMHPDEFIPLAEKDGLIVPLGRTVLREAIGQASIWHNRYPNALPLGVFVNAAPRELATADYAAYVRGLLDESGLPPTRLGIEITERAFVDARNTTIAANIDELAAMGVHLSLDDFGTAYSTLASLKQFPFSFMKIDRSFISAIKTTADSAPISRAIITLGEALDLTVIAEGVETDIQAHHLRHLHCQAAQGYLYARPQPADAIPAYLSAGTTINQHAASHA